MQKLVSQFGIAKLVKITLIYFMLFDRYIELKNKNKKTITVIN